MLAHTVNKSKILLWSLLLLIIIITLSDNHLPIFAIATPLKVGLIIILFFGNFKSTFNSNASLKLYKYFVPFYFLATLSLIAADLDLNALFKTFIYFLNIALIPFLVYQAYKYSPKEFLQFFLYTIFGILLIGLLLKVIGFGGVTYVRYRGLLGNPNGLGLFTLFSAVAFKIIHFYNPNILKRNYIWIGWGLIIASLVLSNSRNSIIALILFFLFSSNIFKYKRFLQIGSVALAILFFSFLSRQAYEIIEVAGFKKEMRIDSYEKMQSGSGRKVAHDFAISYIADNLWLGKGIGTTEKIYKEAKMELGAKGHVGNAHNSFFTIWIDTGVFGLIIFCAAWLALFFKVEKRTGFGFPIMIAVGFSAYFESYLAAVLNPYTTLLLVILTLLLMPEFPTFSKKEIEGA